MIYRRLARRPAWDFSFGANLDLHFCLLALLSAFLLFANLHRGGLAGYDDAVYAHEGKQMLLRGDWWNIWLNDRLDFDKPPLFIWLEAASLHVFGVTDFAAKFPAALAGWGAILLVYGLARELTGCRQLAALAMFVLATTQYFLKYAMHAMTDAPFTFLFTLALFCYVKSWRHPPWLLAFGAAAGLAMLTRSLIGLFPLGVVLLHLLIVRRFDLWRSPYLLGGVAVSLALPLAWFVPQWLAHGPRFLNLHLSYTADNLASIPRGETQRFGLALLHYPWLLVKLYWPWLPALLAGGWWAAQRAWRTREAAATLLLVWVAVVVLPFSLIENKVLRYLLPAFPAFSLLAASALQQWTPAHRRAAALPLAHLLLTAVCVATTVFPNHLPRAQDVASLAAIADRYAPPAERIQFYAAGAARWDYVHQLLWYGDRSCDLLTGATPPPECLQRVTIMDRASFANLPPTLAVEVLGETTTFVCLRRNVQTAALHASLADDALPSASPKSTQ